MIYLHKKISDFKSSDFGLISVYLHAGKVVVLPTDTIYGLSCLALDKEAVKNIFRLKKRDTNKPMITLISSLAMAKRYAYIEKAQEKTLNNLWFLNPRPTTVILKAKNNLPKELVSKTGGVSLRLPKSDFLIKIIKKVKAPIISTSLNLSGASPVNNVNDLNLIFPGKNKPDLIINIGKAKRKIPSRLVDLRDGDLKIIRK